MTKKKLELAKEFLDKYHKLSKKGFFNKISIFFNNMDDKIELSKDVLEFYEDTTIAELKEMIIDTETLTLEEFKQRHEND